MIYAFATIWKDKDVKEHRVVYDNIHIVLSVFMHKMKIFAMMFDVILVQRKL